MKTEAQLELELTEDIGQLVYDPVGFVRYAYPWRTPNTPLVEHTGPDVWHIDVMNRIGKELRTANTAVRIAISSGHGVGKTAMVSWLIHWWLSTRVESQVVATSNTRVQLLTKLWKELALWNGRAVNEHWFEWNATSFKSTETPATWGANAVPFNPNKPEAFAGLHARDVMVIIDEASAVPDSIFQVIHGAMTTPGSLWVICGNPTRNSGAFYDAFHAKRHRWITFQVDSRDAKMTNKEELQEWIADNGIDSDFCKVRIRGMFPSVGLMQLIPTELVERAASRSVPVVEGAAKVLAVDVARHGDDESVITRRHGNKVLPQQKILDPDLMRVAAKAALAIDDFNPDAVMVDGTGLGGGVVDRLRQLGFSNVIDVQGSETANEPQKYKNRRGENWGRMRDWFRGDVDIPDDPALTAQLVALEYWYNEKDQVQLETKKVLKARLPELGSPDEADSLALTFAEPVRQRRLVMQPDRRIVRRPAMSRSGSSWRLQ